MNTANSKPAPNPTSFTEKSSDPGFLVAKGRFRVPAEKQRDKLSERRDALIRDTGDGAHPQVVALCRQIDVINKQIDHDRRHAERTHVKQLASAIYMTMSKWGDARIRAVGKAATYNAVKSIAIASGHCRQKGIELCFDVCFDEGNLGNLRGVGHVETVTAMLFNLTDHRNWYKEKKGEEDGN